IVQDDDRRHPRACAVSRLEGGGNSAVISMLTAPSVPMVSQTEIDSMKTALSPVLASYCLRNGRTRLWPRARFVFSVPRVQHRAARAAAAPNNAAVAAKAATTPIKTGLVDSLNRPGGNITGASFLSSDIMAKMLEALHELRRSASRYRRRCSHAPTR